MEEPDELECGDPAAALLLEGNDVAKDIGACVNAVSVSEKLPASDLSVFIDLETKENNRYCIELSTCGYRVVGFDYGKHDETEQPYYETIYMLLDSLSPLYRLSFADCLASKLSEVVQRDTDAGVSRTAGDDES